MRGLRVYQRETYRVCGGAFGDGREAVYRMSKLPEFIEAILGVNNPRPAEPPPVAVDHRQLRAAVLKEIVRRGTSYVLCEGQHYKVTCVKVELTDQK